MTNLLTTLCLTVAVLLGSSGVGYADNLWSALKSDNHLVLIRHALAPGYGDPDYFDVKDCKTQRNLHDEGRYQSKKIGDLFRSNGIGKAVVYSSQWCRCLDTARLLDLGEVSELPSLNSFFQHLEKEQSQTEQMMRWIQNAPLDTPTVLVSHQVNITALTGYSPASGEIVFLRRSTDGSILVIGTNQTLN
jgi:broad specificity phosphatase PhoE